MIGHILSEMFSWPFGIVVGNLIASGITGILAAVWTHFKLRKQTSNLQEHHERKIDELHAKIIEGIGK